MSNHMAMMMNMMMGGSGHGGHSGGMMMGLGMMNFSGFPEMMMGPGQLTTAFQSQTGSTIVNSGWQTGNTIDVVLNGNGSAYDASDIHVMVFPHLT